MIEEQKLSVSDLLGGGWNVLRSAKGIAVFWIIAFCAVEFLFSYFEQHEIEGFSDAFGPVSVSSSAAEWFWFAVYVIAMALLVPLSTRSMMRDEVGANQYQFKLAIVPISIAAYLLSLSAILIGLIFLIVPGLYLMARWYIVMPLAASGAANLLDSFRLSWSATGASAGALAGVTLIIYLPTGLISAATVTLTIGSDIRLDVWALITNILSAAAAIYSIAISIFAYRKLIDDHKEMHEVFA